MQLEIELAEEVGRIVCEKCGGDLGPKQPLPDTLTFCRTCHLWVGNDGREHKIRKEVKKRGFAIDNEQSEEKKGRTKKYSRTRRTKSKCF